MHGPQDRGRPVKPTLGEITAVPCPHCGLANDLRILQEQGLDLAGATMECGDEKGNGCGKLSRIQGVGECLLPQDNLDKPPCPKQPCLHSDIETVAIMGLVIGKGQPTAGPVTKCACPACKTILSFQNLYQQQLLARGNQVACDRCQAMCTVTMVNVTTPIILFPLES